MTQTQRFEINDFFFWYQTWTPSTIQVAVLLQTTWWCTYLIPRSLFKILTYIFSRSTAPSSSWICPSAILAPIWWPVPSSSTATTTTTTPSVTSTQTAAPAWPSKSWECDGSGNDGWTVDWQGNSCIYDVPESNGAWLWFGVNFGESLEFRSPSSLANPTG